MNRQRLLLLTFVVFLVAATLSLILIPFGRMSLLELVINHVFGNFLSG
jgi:hypothetical protein